MNPILEKYQQLTDREKLLVSVSVVVVVIAILYYGLWSPMNRSLEASRAAVESQKADLAWIQRNANKAIQLRSGSNVAVNFRGSLTQAVNQTASQMRIAISRMQPQGEELKVWVDEAPFNDVLSWLGNMESKGIKIINLDVVQADAPGLVKIRSLQLGKS
jgi:general secretion pathway protein M